MAIHLVTGYAGGAHITSADSGALNAGIVGNGDYVLNTGTKLAASIISNNIIRIADGDAIIQGRHVNLKSGTHEDVIILNGAQNMRRNDLIVLQYEKETASGIENVYLTVLQGVPATGTAADPAPTTGNILAGDTLHEMPLYRVKLEGLTVTAVEPLFETIDNLKDATVLIAAQAKDVAALQKEVTEQNGKILFPDFVNAIMVANHENIENDVNFTIIADETAYYFIRTSTYSVSTTPFLRFLVGNYTYESQGISGTYKYQTSPPILIKAGTPFTVRIVGEHRYLFKVPLVNEL